MKEAVSAETSVAHSVYSPTCSETCPQLLLYLLGFALFLCLNSVKPSPRGFPIGIVLSWIYWACCANSPSAFPLHASFVT